MTKAQDVFDIAISLIDERLESGLIDPNSTKMYKANTPFILTTLQDEITPLSNYTKTLTIQKQYIKPLIGIKEISTHNFGDVIIESKEIARAYSFEASGKGMVYIEDFKGVWNAKDFIELEETKTYKGLIVPTSGATKTRIRFSGDNYYTFSNAALFKENFYSSDEIPRYSEYTKIDLPGDLQNINQIISEEFDYEQMTDYKWENEKDLYIPYNYIGTIRITYIPIPKPISKMDDLLVLDDRICRTVLANGLASRLLTNENQKLANYFNDIYSELKIGLKTKKIKGSSKKIDKIGLSLRY